MVSRFHTRSLLEKLMSGHKMKPDELDQLLEEKVSEDLFLDYKHAAELKDRKKACRTIRRYVSGFANSAGGTLIIGVNENTWEVTPCEAVLTVDLAEWASRCLTEIAHYFSPTPRFQVIRHPKGNVLVIAVSRSLSLVPCKEKRGLVYYLRFHDQTLSNKTLGVPEYLVADLMLGRRRRPHLGISQISMRPSAAEVDHGRLVNFDLVFTVENGSLSWASEIKIGIVCWSRCKPAYLSDQLMSYVDVRDVDEEFYTSDEYNVHHRTTDDISHAKMNLDPFSMTRSSFRGITIPVRILSKFHDYTWKSAIYLMSRETPPIWYQLDLRVDSALLIAANEQREISVDSDLIEIVRLVGERPIVDWEGFGITE